MPSFSGREKPSLSLRHRRAGRGRAVQDQAAAAAAQAEAEAQAQQQTTKDEFDRNLTLKNEYERLVADAAIEGIYLSPAHVYAMAQVLRRPIVVYHEHPGPILLTGTNMEGVYLPMSWRPDEMYLSKDPLAVLFTDREGQGGGHFTSLVFEERGGDGVADTTTTDDDDDDNDDDEGGEGNIPSAAEVIAGAGTTEALSKSDTAERTAAA